MTGVLDWSHDIATAAGASGARERQADADERHRLAEALELLQCERLLARYEVVPLAEGRYRLRGSLDADVVQVCVVTLEPVAAHIAETFDVEFWPDTHHHEVERGDRPILGGDEPEAIEGGRIGVGRIVFEHLSAALDPYPRRADAKLEWQVDKAQEGDNPFQVLERFKK